MLKNKFFITLAAAVVMAMSGWLASADLASASDSNNSRTARIITRTGAVSGGRVINRNSGSVSGGRSINRGQGSTWSGGRTINRGRGNGASNGGRVINRNIGASSSSNSSRIIVRGFGSAFGRGAIIQNNLVRDSSTGQLFFVGNGQRQKVSSLDDLRAIANGQPIFSASNSFLAGIPLTEDNPARLFADNSLVRGNDGRLFVVSGGSRQLVTSLDDLRLFHQGQAIRQVDDRLLNQIPLTDSNLNIIF